MSTREVSVPKRIAPKSRTELAIWVFVVLEAVGIAAALSLR